MYIIIVGAGDLGYYVAQTLLEENHDVVVIEKDQKLAEKISSELGVIVSQGDATETQLLEKMGIKEADALIALTDSDETNMIVCLMAKEAGARQVAARISKLDYDEKVLQKLGIDLVIHPEAAAAGYIAELITKPDVLDLAFISRGDAEIMEIAIGPKNKNIGKKIKSIEKPEGSAIVAIYRKGQLTIPSPESKIKQGDKLLILAKRDIAEKVRKKIIR